MITRLAHICIGATNLAESEKFYCDLLGMKKVFEFIKNGEYWGFYAAAGSTTFIEVFSQEIPANYERPIIKHLCLEVEDLEAVIASIRSKGGQITDRKMGGDNTWQAWIKDPSGVDIELQQYTDKSSQFTGTPCPVTW